MRVRCVRLLVALLLAVVLHVSNVAARPFEVPTFEVVLDQPYRPTVAAGADGTMLFVTSFNAVSARLYAGDGTPAGDAVPLGFGFGASVVADGAGGYVAAISRSNGNAGMDIFGVHLDASAQVIGTQFLVNDVVLDVAATAVVALPSKWLFVWNQTGNLRGRFFATNGTPLGASFTVTQSSGGPAIGAAALDDGGYALAWTPGGARTFHADGSPRSPTISWSGYRAIYGVASSPAGGFAVVSTTGSGNDCDVHVDVLDDDGAAVGQTIVANEGATIVQPNIAADPFGNWNVVWGGVKYDNAQSHGFIEPRARSLTFAAVPREPVFSLSADHLAPIVFTTRLAGGSFANVWPSYEVSTQSPPRAFANVVSLCTPNVAVCGDGVIEPRCEECDDGAANSDTTPDACRSTRCVLPSCGDGVVDSGEDCDDGNDDRCDGCDATCHLEIGLGCGDGLVVPGCTDPCDDGNTIIGDGCTPQCTLERIPGGGPLLSDCWAEWIVNNPTNVPLLDAHGAISAKQACVDNDPGCDFDGGTPGSCTFRVRVCANNTDLVSCGPATRLATWQLVNPTEKKAATHPAYAAIRAAFAATVPAAIVGPAQYDVCSDDVLVVVPLRAIGDGYRKSKVALKAVATLYDGRIDVDKLRLTCVPSTP